MKPTAYSTVSPYLIVQGAGRVIDFLVDAFGAEELRRFPLPDGTLMHAEVRIGESVIMLGDAGGQWEPAPAHLHLYVDDVLATFERAVGLGGQPVREPSREKDGELRGGVRDPGGNTWWIASAAG